MRTGYMKPTGKTRKQRAADFGTAKRCCGTLDYIAECRGVSRKAGSPGWQGHIDAVNKIEWKKMTVG